MAELAKQSWKAWGKLDGKQHQFSFKLGHFYPVILKWLACSVIGCSSVGLSFCM